jgi:hypothetical protein
MGQDQINSNHERNLQKNIGTVPSESKSNQPAEAARAPEAPAAGGTHLIGTCYSSPLVIPAAAFSSDGWDPGSMFFDFGGGYVTGNSANDGCCKAPAYLPNGATITSMYVTLYDNDPSAMAWVDLWRVHNTTGVTDWMATVESSGTSTNIQVLSDSSIDEPLVDYPNYSYYVTSCLDSSLTRIYSVRIYFSGPTS